MAKRRRKNKKSNNASLGIIILLCVVGIALISVPVAGGSFISDIKDIFTGFIDDISGYHGIDRQAEELADLEENGDKLLLYAIDTGNSDCILLRTPEGSSMLVDAADNDDFKNISGTMKALGIEQLDVAVATHPDADHIGSMDDVILNFDPKAVYMPGIEKQTATYYRMADAITEKDIDPIIVEGPAEFDIGSVHAEILNPYREYSNVNDYSIVLLLTFGENKILLTGDIEEEALNEILSDNPGLLDVDIIKVAHHGSAASISQEWLDATTPEIAFITCGKDNDYGHPHRETLELLNANDITTLRTDLNGDVAIFSDGHNIAYATAA